MCLVALGCGSECLNRFCWASTHSPAGQVEGKQRLGGVAGQLAVGREPEFFLR